MLLTFRVELTCNNFVSLEMSFFRFFRVQCTIIAVSFLYGETLYVFLPGRFSTW